jgi:hypothetical protein
MKTIAFGAGLMIALALAAEARGSGPIGVYCIIDKVVLEPQKEKPDRVQLWGTFVLAKRGDKYSNPVQGYLYYQAEKGSEDICRKEWADMQKVAGTNQLLGFANSYDADSLGKVRKENEKPESPNVFPLGNGVQKIGERNNFAEVKVLRTLARPKDPTDGCIVPPGEISLSARNILDKDHAKAVYVFEIENAKGGEKETSKEVKAGDKETKWAPSKPLKAGQDYVWRVWAKDNAWKGPVSSSTIQVKGQRN